jgi:hypothetical protein
VTSWSDNPTRILTVGENNAQQITVRGRGPNEPAHLAAELKQRSFTLFLVITASSEELHCGGKAQQAVDWLLQQNAKEQAA